MRLIFLILLLIFRSASAADLTLSLGKPSDVGMDATILEAGVNMYRKAIERDEVRSAVILIARKGRVVVHDEVPADGLEPGQPRERGEAEVVVDPQVPADVAQALEIE